MKDKYIVTSAGVDGIVSAAFALEQLDDAMISFTRPATTHNVLNELVEGESGTIFIANLPVSPKNRHSLFRAIRDKKDWEVWYVNNDPFPGGVSASKLNTHNVVVDTTASTAEAIMRRLPGGSRLNIMLAAAASLDEGYTRTSAIGEAGRRYSMEAVGRETKRLRLTVAERYKDHRFNIGLVQHLKRGERLEQYSGFEASHADAVTHWGALKKVADRIVEQHDNIAYVTMEKTSGGWARLIAEYVSKKSGKPIGVCLMETEEDTQPMVFYTSRPDISLHSKVANLAISVSGSGNGGIYRAGAVIPRRKRNEMLRRLDNMLAGG